MGVSVNVETCNLGLFFPVGSFFGLPLGFPPSSPVACFMSPDLCLSSQSWVGFTTGLERGDLKKDMV